MNERMKELYDQAMNYARLHVDECKCYGYYMEDNELEQQFARKFSELIVRECAEIAETAEPYQSHDNILRHFGVE